MKNLYKRIIILIIIIFIGLTNVFTIDFFNKDKDNSYVIAGGSYYVIVNQEQFDAYDDFHDFDEFVSYYNLEKILAE